MWEQWLQLLPTAYQQRLSQLVTIWSFSCIYSWDCTDFANSPNLSRSVDFGGLSNQRFLAAPSGCKIASVATLALQRTRSGNSAETEAISHSAQSSYKN